MILLDKMPKYLLEVKLQPAESDPWNAMIDIRAGN